MTRKIAFTLIGIVVVIGMAGGANLLLSGRHPKAAARLDPAAPGPVSQVSSVPAPAAPGAKLPFTFERLEVDTSHETGEACLVFSEPLKEGPDTHYEDYVSIEGVSGAAFRTAGARLCIAGFSFGANYNVELKPGLPAASGTQLASAESVPVTLADKSPFVKFALPRQFILPRDGNAGVPLSTLNLAEIELKVYRLGERGLFQNQDSSGENYRYETYSVGKRLGPLIWSGKMAIPDRTRNKVVTTAFPIRDVVKPWKPGAYIVLAAETFDSKLNDFDESHMASQLVYDTDLALTTFRGEAGLDVFVRSIGTALPVAGISLALVVQDNDELGRVVSDAAGHARFAPGLLRGKGAAEPLMVMAFGPSGDKDGIGDFNRILLATAAFDLSDRGVSGRPAPGPVDVFIATDRGIYRPGETVNLTALVRDQIGVAIAKAPVSLILLRPNGMEQNRYVLADAGDGAGGLAIPLSVTAQRGLWTVRASLDGKTAVGSASFMVDDFVPERLKLTLSSKASSLAVGDSPSVEAEARFLYGAPAADLSGEAELQLVPDPTPFPTYRNYQFGRDDEKPELKPINLAIDKTDAAGKTSVTGEPLTLPSTSLPLKAQITVGIHEPGGRVTRGSLALPVRSRPVWLGIRQLFSGSVDLGESGQFEIAALDANGQAIAKQGLRYELIHRDLHWQWFEGQRGWSYEPVYKDVLVKSDRFDVAVERPTTLTLPLPQWGTYRLIVRDETTDAVSSVSFRSGWWDSSPDAADTPDKVDVVAERATYRAGETAKLTIKPPFDAEVLLAVAGSRTFEAREVHVPAAGAVVEVPVSAEWGSGAYVMATAYRPLKAGKAHEPVRAVGLSWVGVDLSARTLAVKMAVADHILPRQMLKVPVTVAGLSTGQRAHLVVAAVDEGILQLTRFKTPAPADYYFAKRELGIAMRDDYGKLLDERDAPAGAIRVGGDAALGGAPLPVVPTKSVVLFSGIVETDDAGRAEIAFDVPDFEGELRLMAIAYNGSQLGNGETHVAVRDPVVVQGVLPRFLAPGDRSRLAVLLHNIDGEAGDYKLSVTASGAAALDNATDITVALARGEQRLLKLPLAATDIGIASLAARLSGPGGFVVDHSWQIAVRAPQTPLVTDLSVKLAPGQSVLLNQALTADYVPGSAHVDVTVAPWRSFNIPAILGALDRYPYGCLEQTTSRAFPLLYFNEMAQVGQTKQDKAIPRRVQEAIDRVLDMQTQSGDFGLWGPRDTAYPWLSVFALDFLYEAKRAGYVVPQSALNRGVDWLTLVGRGRGIEDMEFLYHAGDARQTADWHLAHIRAYAFYLLAKLNAVNLSDLRYFYDHHLTILNSALDYGQVGAALAMAGDKARAANAFDRASRILDRNTNADYYGSRLRDLAALTDAASQTGEVRLVSDLTDRLGRLDYRMGWTTTQENAWMLIAAHDLLKGMGDMAIEVDGKAPPGKPPLRLSPGDAELANGVTITNGGGKDVWSLVALEGIPREPEPAREAGFHLAQSFFDLQGNEIDPATLKQNDRFLVSIEALPTDDYDHQAVLVDLLPAGWEIESIVRPEKDGKTDFDWLTLSKVTLSEARDDRFVASATFEGRRGFPRSNASDAANRIHLAFVVRATTPGTFARPAVSIEDMYHPQLNARTAMGTAVVTPQE
jgi:uncharacterized protein YfaS (alpha-2-macroglobulin family)